MSHTEKWSRIPGYGNYEASDNGQVRKKESARVLMQQIDDTGYYRVSIYNDEGQRKSRRTHRFIALAHLPLVDGKPYVNHKDGVRLNNSLANLEWCTMAENNVHAWNTGLQPRPIHGYVGNRAKLKFADAVEIRRLYQDGSYSQRKLASMFGVDQKRLCAIVNFNSYKEDRTTRCLIPAQRLAAAVRVVEEAGL
jgi:hypothetical protein